MSASEGDTIVILCSPEAAPAPTYQWLLDGSDLGLVPGRLPRNGFRLLGNGYLVIDKADVKRPQGVYTCEVTNASGQAASSGRLKLRWECLELFRACANLGQV